MITIYLFLGIPRFLWKL